MGYRLDIDAWKARESKDYLLEDLDITLKKRAEFALECLDREAWDFFILHVMGTDRLHHFLFEEFETNHPKYAPAFMEFYNKVDGVIGEILKRLDDNVTLFVLSDHGFCSMKKEVSVNYHLQQQGFLQMKEGGKSLTDMLPTSQAYSLIPGRIYVNLQGRERFGCVAAGSEYEEVRQAVTESLLQLKDPDTGEAIISHVHRREEVYSGACYEQAPDLVAMPHDGYDLKGNFNAATLTEKGAMTGTHTFDNAMLYVRGRKLRENGLSVMDVTPAVLDIFGIQANGMDGKNCLK
jgi:predicted AlkP superfamily phosphohydrolase/phosphomutase